jgi:hypothetical protein
MNNETTNNMVTFNGETFAFGSELVMSTNRDVKGVLIDKKGKPFVSYVAKGKKKNVNEPLSENWVLAEKLEREQNSETETINPLDAIIAKTESDKSNKGDADNSEPGNPAESQTTTEKVIEQPLTAEEKAELKQLEREFRSLERSRLNALETVENKTFAQAKIAYRIQQSKLYRETMYKDATGKQKLCKKFAEYIVNVLQVQRQHGYLLANVGGFAIDFGDLFENDEKVEIGIRGVNRLVVNRNSLVEQLQLEKATTEEVKPLIEQIIELDKKVGMTDKGVSVLTDKVIDKVGEKVTAELAELSTYAFDDIIGQAVKRLQEKGSVIVENSRKELTEKKKIEKKDFDALTIDDFADFTFSVEKGVLTLKDGRTFRQFFQ